MKNRQDPAELLQYSGEHLRYEIIALWQTANAVPKYAKGTIEHFALLESFATHLRNLIEFLFHPSSREYVRALHFFDDPAQWKRTYTAEWKNLYDRACNEVNHLTKGRDDRDPASRVWNLSEILRQIEPLLRDFATKASTKRLHPRVRELFEQQPDATAPTALVALANVTASTATPTTPYVIVLDQLWRK